jgi:hypothetical protein
MLRKRRCRPAGTARLKIAERANPHVRLATVAASKDGECSSSTTMNIPAYLNRMLPVVSGLRLMPAG